MRLLVWISGAGTNPGSWPYGGCNATAGESRTASWSWTMVCTWPVSQPSSATTVHVTRLLASALRATVAAGLIGELPVTSLQAYADAVLLGERERKQLGVAAMQPELRG